MITLTDIQKKIIEGRVCPYCKKDTTLIHSTKVYSRDYGSFWMYICNPCQAWVGCHKKTKEAKGRVAKLGLRYLKKDAHEVFDKIWKKNIMTRSECYKWLSGQLNLPPEYTHIGMFGEKTCLKVIELSKEKLIINQNQS